MKNLYCSHIAPFLITYVVVATQQKVMEFKGLRNKLSFICIYLWLEDPSVRWVVAPLEL